MLEKAEPPTQGNSGDGARSAAQFASEDTPLPIDTSSSTEPDWTTHEATKTNTGNHREWVAAYMRSEWARLPWHQFVQVQ